MSLMKKLVLAGALVSGLGAYASGEMVEAQGENDSMRGNNIGQVLVIGAGVVLGSLVKYTRPYKWSEGKINELAEYVSKHYS